LKQPRSNHETRSTLLLISLVLFFILAPILEGHRFGGLLLLLNLYITLATATSTLAGRRSVFWTAIPVATVSMILLLVSHYFPTWPWQFANSLVLTVFLMLVSGSLFVYLGQKGEITRGRILASVSLYFLLGLSWFSLYQLIDLLQPGSFSEAGVVLTGEIHWSTMLYFSLVTLTTLGYGDILAVKPMARMLAPLEASAGVLYVAITVARLVGGQTTSKEPAIKEDIL
jgi:hypothetical protein